MIEDNNKGPIAFHIKSLPAATGIPERTWWRCKSDGTVHFFKSGRRVLVMASEVRRYLQSLQSCGGLMRQNHTPDPAVLKRGKTGIEAFVPDEIPLGTPPRASDAAAAIRAARP